jgi:hypothetical protein
MRPLFEASRTTSSSACWGQTQHRSVLDSLPTTSPTSASSLAETDRWARGVHGAVHRNVPLWTGRPPGRPGGGLCMARAAPGSTTTRRARTARRHDPTREFNVCVATASSSFDLEPAPRHRGTDDQQRARLDELAEARRQLDEELDLLHQELGIDVGPRDGHPAQDAPVQGEPHEGNVDRRECRPAADQPRDRVPTPPARAPEPNNNRRTNEGVNANADAPPLFRRASQNLAAAAMLLHGCPEPATSKERRVREQLKALLEAAAAQQVESSTSCQRSECERAEVPSGHGPNPPPPSATGTWGRSRSRGVSSQESSRAPP